MSARAGGRSARTRDPAVRLIATLTLGTTGGAVFTYFDLPLAWMLGAMVVTTVASLGGAPLVVSSVLRSSMIVILGVFLGRSFTPEILDRIGDWPVTLAALAVYLATITGLLYFYFNRFLGYDPTTAYFSATPGGLTEMAITGSAMGGDDRTISLIHGTRVFFVVLVIPFWFRYTTGVSSSASSVAPSFMAISLHEILVLSACGVIGMLAGKALRLPAYLLVGPMIASAIVHITGLSASAPPSELVAAAQVVLGSAVGARFAGVPLARVARTLAAGVGSTAVMLTLTVVFTVVLTRLTGMGVAPLVLAFSPGGLTEMGLISLALGIDTAFVMTHHIARIAIVLGAAPLLFKLAGRRSADP